jgi:hypothetical protein
VLPKRNIVIMLSLSLILIQNVGCSDQPWNAPLL